MRSPFMRTCHLTCDFKKKGSWAAGYHTGEDWVYNDSKYHTLVSPCDGLILKSDYSASYGNYIVIQAKDDNLVILMAHLRAPSHKQKGDTVLESEIIGDIGATGNASGVHLHIEVEEGVSWSYNKNLLRPSDHIQFQQFKSNRFSESKEWKNGATKEYVYSSTSDCINHKNSIGFIYPHEKCHCWGIVDGCYLVIYNLDNHKHKTGFVKYSGGIK